MRQYTFTTPTDQSPVTVELRDDKSAWAEAVKFCSKVLRDNDGDLPSNTDWKITVTGETGQLVATIQIGARRYAPLCGQHSN